MKTIGIRELKENVSLYMRKVKTGEKFVVTDRKKEIAIIMPLTRKNWEEKIDRLIQQGTACWSGGKPEGISKRIVSKGESLSGAVMGDRR